MELDAIARALEPYVSLDPERLALTSKYIDLLLKWNARINLTAIRTPQAIVERHFGESFFVAQRVSEPAPPRSAIDLGSGAGFPGIPLAILLPHTAVTLIEAQGRKSTFLKEAISVLGLKNASVFNGRGENYSGRAELVTMRAVERFSEALLTAVSLVEEGGRVALMVGAGQEGQARSAREMEWEAAVPIPGGHSRILLLGTRRVKVD